MDPDHIRELFSQFRPVEVRRMFGGVGISTDGLTFAIAFEGVIFFRADETSIADFKEEGATPFVYPYTKRPYRRRDPDKAPFWRMPERLYDDPEEAARWAERALEIARRSKTGKRAKPGGKKLTAKKPAARKMAVKKATAAKPPAKKRAKKSAARKALRRT
jgi:DNA transformation protein